MIKFNYRKLKQLRDGMDISVEEFLRRLYVGGIKVSRQTWHLWETGQRPVPITKFFQLCNFFKKDPNFFILKISHGLD
jgi:transcriptional regulator with XRE-family HTH domain